MLMKEYQPTNRARSLELFHIILNYRFAQSKRIAENILEYEGRIEQYEKATGEKVQENLKNSTLIQGMKSEVKRHLLLNLDEKTKYTALRQYLVNYESPERWTNSLAQQGTPHRTTTDLIDKGEVSTKHGTKVKEKNTRVMCTKAKVKVKARTKVRTSEKVSDLKAKAKALVKAEVEETGKVEVEVSEVTKAQVKEEEKVFAGSKERVKARHKQPQEFATIVTSMDTLTHSIDRSSVTWDIKLGTLTLRTQVNKRVLEPQHKPLPQQAELPTKAREAKELKIQ